MTSLPTLRLANASFVTDRLLVGGDLHPDRHVAADQLAELLDAGVTHVLDVRLEHSDEVWVRGLAPALTYRHLGVHDLGRRQDPRWFDEGVAFVLDAIDAGGTVLAHCHMGINRGPSMGLAVLLASGHDVVTALDLVRGARSIAFMDYAIDALEWHHTRTSADFATRLRDHERLAAWRAADPLDARAVIRRIRLAEGA